MTKDFKEEIDKRKLRVMSSVDFFTDPDNSSIGVVNAIRNLRGIEQYFGIRETTVTEEVLLDLVKDIGNTPIKEEKVAKLLNNEDKLGVINYFKNKKENKDIDFNQFSYTEISNFIQMVNNKIFDFKDENGVYKTTQNTENREIGVFVMFELEKEVVKIDSLIDAVEIKKAKEDLSSKILKNSGLDLEKLTKWEKELVVDDTVAIMKLETKSSLGGF